MKCLTSLRSMLRVGGLALTLASAGSAFAQFNYSVYSGVPLQAGATDGARESARYDNPTGITRDSAGNTYIASTSGQTIRKISASGVVSTLAGSAGQAGSTDGTGSAARFSYPWGLTADADGNIYVADSGNHTVRKITSAGVVTTIAGTAGETGTVDGVGAAARFERPSSITRDASGNLYVSDYSSSTIRRIAPNGTVTTFAGSPAQFGHADGQGTAARFNYPDGLCIDSAGNLYVADTNNHVIRRITPAGAVTTFAGVPGQSGIRDGAAGSALFNEPVGIALEPSGDFVITDRGNHVIRRITTAGYVTTVGGVAGESGVAFGNGASTRFDYPTGIVVSAGGHLLITDTYNQLVYHGDSKLAPQHYVTAPERFPAARMRERYPALQVFGTDDDALWEYFVSAGVYEGMTDGDFDPTSYLDQSTFARRWFMADLGAATAYWYHFDHRPVVNLSLSSQRYIGGTVSVDVTIDDPEDDYVFGNLWVFTPGRGWMTIRADSSAVVSGSLSAENTVAGTEGVHTRTFTFTPETGEGGYTFSAAAVDAFGFRGDSPLTTIAVTANQPPQASFSLSSERAVGQTLTISLNLSDPNNNYAFANLWVHTPNRGWLSLREDSSVVVSGSLDPQNSVANTAGVYTRTFALTSLDGPGDYTFSLAAVDSAGLRADAPLQTVRVTATASQPPSASFSLSSERSIGQTLSITVNLADADGDYSFANLWVRTPNRGWVTIKADNSVAVSGSLSAANTVAATTGTVVRTFNLSALDGPGTYTFSLAAVDAAGQRTDAPLQTITVLDAGNQAPTASFSLSNERSVGQAVTVSLTVGDPDGNYSYANLWVRTPDRRWFSIRADNSLVESGSLSAANTVAASAGTYQRTFTFTPTFGPGTYTFSLAAVDAAGVRTDAALQQITVDP